MTQLYHFVGSILEIFKCDSFSMPGKDLLLCVAPKFQTDLQKRYKFTSSIWV